MPGFEWPMIALGAAGGLLPDAIRFAKERHQGFPEWFKKGGYWIGLTVLVLLGALASWLGGADEWRAALAMGFAAPEVLSRLLATDEPQLKGDGEGFNIRYWWSK